MEQGHTQGTNKRDASARSVSVNQNAGFLPRRPAFTPFIVEHALKMQKMFDSSSTF
jgi:hypothetical protein